MLALGKKNIFKDCINVLHYYRKTLGVEEYVMKLLLSSAGICELFVVVVEDNCRIVASTFCSWDNCHKT